MIQVEFDSKVYVIPGMHIRFCFLGLRLNSVSKIHILLSIGTRNYFSFLGLKSNSVPTPRIPGIQIEFVPTVHSILKIEIEL